MPFANESLAHVSYMLVTGALKLRPRVIPMTECLCPGDRATVDLTYYHAQFLHVSGHDLTAHVQMRGHTHHLQLRPVSRLEVSARDVRARLARCAGGERPPPPPAPAPAVTALVEEPAAEPEPASAQLRLTLAADCLSLALADDVSDVAVSQEVVRLTADGAVLQLTPCSGGRSRLSACLSDLQLDSQLPPAAGQHYQVLLAACEPARPPPLLPLPALQLSAALNTLRRAALLLAELELQLGSGSCQLRAMRLVARPLRLFVEDRCQAAYVCFLRRLAAAARPLEPAGAGGLPAEVAAELTALASRVCVDSLRVEPLQLLLSVRTQLQLSLSIDETPLQLPAFEATDVRSSPEHLLESVVRHYMWSAIYKAGQSPQGTVVSIPLCLRWIIVLEYFVVWA